MSKYQVVRELGHNREGGRITYLATDTSLNPPQEVVIKEFRFATSDANWSGFKAYQREIDILRQLDHPRIPRYLDSYETNTGFCLVQEYKKAPSLAQQRSFTPEEIKQIAISVLEILVYLQKRTPAVIHRDIKPENILVDKQPILFSIKQGEEQKSKLPLTAYLVDFGFARIRDGELALSSVAAGTPGFMPPEEQFGRTLTEASDLYSLGATLICLLTGTRSVDVGKLIDDNYRFNFKKLVPKVSPHFISWLEKMVAPNVKQRYANAAAALEALKRPVLVRDRAQTNRRAAVVLGVIIFTSVGTTLMNSQPKSSGNYSQPKNPWNYSQPKSSGNYSQPKNSWNYSQPWYYSQPKSSGNYSQPKNPESRIINQESSVKKLLKTKECLKCYLVNVNLSGAYLLDAKLSDAKLSGATLSGATLSGAILSGADLSSANLSGAYLSGADLSRAYLSSANLSSAYLWGANLWGADLSDAKLSGANLSGTNLWGANLWGANLENANLKDANLNNAKLNGANLKNTIMPDGTRHK